MNLIFRFFQTKTVCEIWLYDNKEIRFEGKIIGFDEYMNLTLDDAYEMYFIQLDIKKLSKNKL